MISRVLVRIVGVRMVWPEFPTTNNASAFATTTAEQVLEFGKGAAVIEIESPKNCHITIASEMPQVGSKGE